MATLKDVADYVGVSPITVSRVINDPESVKQSTREKILLGMKELKYYPNSTAKFLATNKSGIVVVYVPEYFDISNPFVMYLIAGISNALSEQMYSFLLLRNLDREHLCDGYIVTGLLRDGVPDFAKYARDRERPVALFGHTKVTDIDYIDVDNKRGSKLGVDYLIENGHRKIAMINVLEDKDYTTERYEGYCEALESNDIPLNQNLVLQVPNSVEGGEEAAQELLKRGEFTAIFCATDTIGVGAATELKRRGFNIPNDISLLGFDGLGHNNLISPPMTTIKQPVYEIGESLARALLERLNGKEERIHQLVMPELIRGGTVTRPQ